MPKTKEEKAKYKAEYYKKNKEKIEKQKKEYRKKNKEKIAKTQKEYRDKNKEEISKMQKEYRQTHKEEKAEYQKEYYENHKEEAAEYHKEYGKKYNQSPNGKKSHTIGGWKKRGIKTDNYDMLYNNYLSETHCDFCRVKFGEWGDGTGTFKCCDHNHETGLFRNFLCSKCNIKRG